MMKQTTTQTKGNEMNMSHCRFQNTSTDLQDCIEYLSNMSNNPTETEALSREELKAAKQLAVKALKLVEMCTEMLGEDIENADEEDMEEGIDRFQELVKTEKGEY